MHKPILTGWIGNSYAKNFQDVSDDDLLALALEQLQSCFANFDVTKAYRTGAVFRFTKHSPSGGGYSWLKPERKKPSTRSTKVSKIRFGSPAKHCIPVPSPEQLKLRCKAADIRRGRY
jgi:hypothetical protein